MEIDSDKIFKGILFASGIFLLIILILIVYSLYKESGISLSKFGFNFILNKEWNPVDENFGMLPFIIGTFATSILALLISLPFSLCLALLLGVYLKEGFLSSLVSNSVDLLAGIPSVIYGFWGLFFLVPIIRQIEIKLKIIPYGVGILTASIVLAIMIIPYTTSIAREIIKMVPADLKEGGYSLGATRYEVIKKIIFPFARSGIFAGILLAFGRAFGETMAVTMVIGNSHNLPSNIFSPSNTMASVIANEFTEATKNIHLSALIQIALWLCVFTIIINILGQYVISKFEVKR